MDSFFYGYIYIARSMRHGQVTEVEFKNAFSIEVPCKHFWLFFLVCSLLFYSLVPQISSEKLFRPQNTTPITISEHVWSCRDVFAGILFWVNLGLVRRNCLLWPLLAEFHIMSYHFISCSIRLDIACLHGMTGYIHLYPIAMFWSVEACSTNQGWRTLPAQRG